MVKSAGRTRIHNVRFYNLTPRSILCMSYNSVWHKLALSRTDGSIELWSMEYAPVLEQTIWQPPGSSVEGLAWTGKRLFSAGLSGEVVEWNLETLQPLRRQHATGNSIWCIDINWKGTRLAIGTEQGYINIFDITDYQLVFKKLFDKQEGRVLCCKYDPKGKYLVTGSTGAIRIWDVKKGHALHKLTVARTEKRKAVIIWSLQVLQDLTIISGDSRGQFSVWDGNRGAFVESHQVLAADVLAVTVNEAEDMVICAGIEPIIRIYAKTKIKREDSTYYTWVKYLQRSTVHEHDVKVLACAGERILSGGLDGFLGISSWSKMTCAVEKYGPFLKSPCVAAAPQCGLILLQYFDFLEVWRLGSSSGKQVLQLKDAEEDSSTRKQPKTLSLSELPEKLLLLKCTKDKNIVCASISPNGLWICYSTTDDIRLFRFVAAENGKCETELSRVQVMVEEFAAASHLQFSSNSERLFIVRRDTKDIMIFNMLPNESSSMDFLERLPTGKHIKEAISLLSVSKCGNFIAAAGICRSIAVWSLNKKKYFEHYLNLPRYVASTTAIAFRPNMPRLVVAFADAKIFEYDLDDLRFISSDKDYPIRGVQAHCITNIVLDERDPDVVILQNATQIFVLKKSIPPAIKDQSTQDESSSSVAETSERKESLKKSKSTEGNCDLRPMRVMFQEHYEHLVHLTWLRPNELVAVGVNPDSLIEDLPPPFKQKKFGVS